MNTDPRGNRYRPDVPNDEQPLHPHLFLRVLIDMVGNLDFEIAMTLLVSGSWISGTLTSPRRYLDASASSVRSLASGPGADDFVKGWEAAMEYLVGEIVSRPPKGEDDHRVAHTVYLRDARMWLPGGTPIDDLVLSVRASEIDAFFIGRLG